MHVFIIIDHLIVRCKDVKKKYKKDVNMKLETLFNDCHYILHVFRNLKLICDKNVPHTHTKLIFRLI